VALRLCRFRPLTTLQRVGTLLFCLLALNLADAQNFTSPTPGQESADFVARLQKTIAKQQRFLGWKFAKSAGIMPRWQRSKSNHGSLPESRSAQSIYSRAEVTAPLGTGSTYAGFLFRKALPTGFIPTAVTQGDFNEDGDMDIAISNGGDNTIFVLFGNGDNTFKVPEILYTRGQSPVWITAVKLGNGHVDLAVVNADSANVEIFLGNGDGTFKQGALLPLPQVPTFVLPADVNQDGKQDLVVGLILDVDSTEPQFEVLLGNGAGGFSGQVFPPSIYSDPDFAVPTGWVSVGDFRKDGFPDVLTTVTGGKVLPYVNQSGTTFSLGNRIGNPFVGTMVAELGDMDEDGCLDVVEPNIYGFVAIDKGSCDGNFTFGPNDLAQMGDLDPAIKLIDVDGDGHLDLVASAAFYDTGGLGVGTEGGYLVSVLKGDGHGNIAPPQVYRGGTDEYSLVVGDFNGDNKPEIITTDSLENCVSLFANDGSGQFDKPRGEAIGYVNGGVYAAPYPLGSTQTADFNGDSKADILLMEYGVVGEAPVFAVMLNNGTGDFLPPVRTSITIGDASPVPTYIAGKFRTSGVPDIIYINTYNGFNTTHYVAYFLGKGDGTFQSPVTITTLPDPLKISTGDFNNDGNLDFAVYGTDGTAVNQQLDVFLGHGNGTFTQLPSFKFPFITGSSTPVVAMQFMSGDFDHDGKIDLLVGNNGNGGWLASGDDLLLAQGNGNGTFSRPTVLIPHFGAVAVGDLNHDGYLDLVQKKDPAEDVSAQLFFQPAVTVYLGQPGGSFQQQPPYFLPGVGLPSLDPVLLGDFNGDGNLDICYREFPTEYFLLIESRLHILQGRGDGSFSIAGQVYQLPALSNPILGADFNGDNAEDLIELTGLTSSFHTIDAGRPPALDIAFNSNPILSNSGKATVTLSQPSSNALDVTLSASNPAVRLPASLHFPAGQQTQQFSFTLSSGLDASHVIAIYAQLGTETAVDYGYKPNPNLPTGVAASLLKGVYTLYPSLVSITPGESFVLTLELDSVSGYSGTFTSFNCAGLPANASCSFDGSSMLLLPGGVSRVNFTVTTSTSTPFGTFPLQITSTDGIFTALTTFSLGIGDFSLSVDPALISIGPSGTNSLSLIATPTNGLNENATLACSGLPTGATCGSNIAATSGTTTVQVSGARVPAGDYPFQLTMQAHILSHVASATLRVGDFSASLDKTTATLSAGQSASFVLTLGSINHYANTLSIFCQPPSNSVLCSASSPTISLTDSSNSTVTLTVSRPAAANAEVKHGRESLLSILVPVGLALPLLTLTRKSKMIPGFMLLVSLIILSSCGGGSGIGGGGGEGTNPPPPPPPQTVSISVIAQANSTFDDSGNQRIVGPIVITIK
jgi:hypothetical protein